MLPVHEVAADRVAPGHVSPRVAERVVLVEEVVLALVVDQAVGIVHPVLRRREVELRPERLLIGRRTRRRRARRARERPERQPECRGDQSPERRAETSRAERVRVPLMSHLSRAARSPETAIPTSATLAKRFQKRKPEILTCGLQVRTTVDCPPSARTEARQKTFPAQRRTPRSLHAIHQLHRSSSTARKDAAAAGAPPPGRIAKARPSPSHLHEGSRGADPQQRTARECLWTTCDSADRSRADACFVLSEHAPCGAGRRRAAGPGV